MLDRHRSGSWVHRHDPGEWRNEQHRGNKRVSIANRVTVLPTTHKLAISEVGASHVG